MQKLYPETSINSTSMAGGNMSPMTSTYSMNSMGMTVGGMSSVSPQGGSFGASVLGSSGMSGMGAAMNTMSSQCLTSAPIGYSSMGSPITNMGSCMGGNGMSSMAAMGGYSSVPGSREVLGDPGSPNSAALQRVRTKPLKMFTYKLMDSDLTRGLVTEQHDRQIEIRLADTSDMPVASELDINSNRCVITYKYLQYAERISNLTVYEDDVWIVTFPKCGTTWTQEMVWLIDHNLDYEAAGNVDLTFRSVFLEASAMNDNHPEDTVEMVQNLTRPRHIKSHLPLAMLPKQLWSVKPKIVYCARNPKDVAVSYMHHYRHLHGYTGTNEMFLEGFLADQVLWCPQIQHVLDFWNIRHLDNVLFNHFEEMKKDMRGVLERTCKFFGKTYTDLDLTNLAEHLSFDTMKKNPTANHTTLLKKLGEIRNKKIEFQFMRKGQVGSYKEELTPEYIQRLQNHVNKQLEGSTFQFIEI